MSVEIAPLGPADLDEAHRIFNVAFGTFLGAPDPTKTFGDRDLLRARWRAGATVLAAHENGRLIGSNVITRWGSFGFFGPLTVLPEFWDKGIAQKLLAGTVEVFDKWGLQHSGLFTFPNSAKHVGLYQKFGYWPQYLTALMKKTPEAKAGSGAELFSKLDEKGRTQALTDVRELTNGLSAGLDLSSEIQALFDAKVGETLLLRGRDGLDGFALCHTGPGSEGGSTLCYVKFAALRSGPGAGERFERLLDAIETFGAERGVDVEAGVNLAREDAYRRMRLRGYRTFTQGVAMQRPHTPGFNRPEVYAIDDWR